MKIALVILHGQASRGGAERYTIDIAAALAGAGHEPSILAADFGPPIPGVRLVPLATSGAMRRARYAAFLDSLDAHLASEHYHIVHAMLPVRRCDLYHPHAGLAAASLADGHHKYNGRLSRAAAKLGNRLNFKRRHFASVERRLLTSPRPPVVLCLSDYVKQTIRRHYSLPDDRLMTLFNAVDLRRFDPAGPGAPRRPDRILALMVAQDFDRKGLRHAIEAIARLADPRVLLLVAGRDQPDSYQRLARDLNIAEQVQFLGQVPDPVPLYRSADFLLLPTRHDPCSLATLEALAMGIPVISTVFNGACQIMANGRHGFVLDDPNDVPALAQAIRQLLDPTLRSEMRNACLTVRPQLSFEAHVSRLLAIYDSCCNLKTSDATGSG